MCDKQAATNQTNIGVTQEWQIHLSDTNKCHFYTGNFNKKHESRR
jgi:hypothetical protein